MNGKLILRFSIYFNKIVTKNMHCKWIEFDQRLMMIFISKLSPLEYGPDRTALIGTRNP